MLETGDKTGDLGVQIHQLGEAGAESWVRFISFVSVEGTVGMGTETVENGSVDGNGQVNVMETVWCYGILRLVLSFCHNSFFCDFPKCCDPV